MTKDVINAANVSLDACSIIICLIITCALSYFKKKDESAKWFVYTNISAIIYGIADIFMWISEGRDAGWKLIALPLSSFIYYFSGIFIIYFYIGYLIRYYQKDRKIHKGYSTFCLGISILYMILLFLTPPFGLYYTISAENTYSRGNWFVILVAIEVILYLEALFLIVKYHKNVQNLENVGFASFIFFPFVSHIIQIANFGVALISLGLAISFLIIFISLTLRLQRETENERINNNENKLKNLIKHEKTILSLTNLLENRYLEGSRHEIRLSRAVEEIVLACMKKGLYPEIITENYKNYIIEAVPFHDIGKITISDTILTKPGKLTAEEYAEIQKHPKNGERILIDILSINYTREFVKIASQLCAYHHEKWNGRGYPENLKGENIPLCARIMAIVDVFDALVTYRCYKSKVSYDEGFETIKKAAGEQFDPNLVRVFLELKDKIIEIYEEYKDN